MELLTAAVSFALAVIGNDSLVTALPTCPENDANCLTVRAPDICGQLEKKLGVPYKECYSLEPWNARSGPNAPEPFEGAVDIPAQLASLEGVISHNTVRSYASAHPCGDSSVFALKGFDENGHAIIVTDEGERIFITPDLDIGYTGARKLIDRNTGDIIDELVAPHDNVALFGFYFKSVEEVIFFTKERCLTASGPKHGRINDISSDCHSLAEGEVMRSQKSKPIYDVGLEKASASDLEIAAKAIPWAVEYIGEYFARRVGRISGSNVIVVDTLESCT